MAELRTGNSSNASLRIGVVGLRGIPGVMGGIESHVEQLYPRIKAIRPNWSIHIAERAPYVDATRREYQGLALQPLPAVRNKYLETITHTFLAILFLRMRTGCKLLHVHAIGPGLLVPLARLLGMRVVLTHHGEDYQRAKWNGLAKRLLRIGEWVAIKAAHKTIVVSERLCQSLRERYPARAVDIHPIPNGASAVFRGGDRAWSPDVLASLGLEPGNFILAVGRLVPEKGFDDLIAAVRASGDTRKLVIVGKADFEDDYARRLMSAADDQIVFAGFQTHEALRSLYAAASLFVLPSYHEGLPIAALEAAEMNAPMLLSDIPANLEVGLAPVCYFETGSVAALAAKLRQPPSTFRIASAEVTQRFDWDEIARATDTVFADALD